MVDLCGEDNENVRFLILAVCLVDFVLHFMMSAPPTFPVITLSCFASATTISRFFPANERTNRIYIRNAALHMRCAHGFRNLNGFYAWPRVERPLHVVRLGDSTRENGAKTPHINCIA